jgi:hypothetical protein
MRKITPVAAICSLTVTMMILAGWKFAPTEPKAAIETIGPAKASMAPILEMMATHGKSLPVQAWDAF